MLGEGGVVEDSHIEFLEKTFRATKDEAEVVSLAIRNSMGSNRFATYASLRIGVVAARWKDKYFYGVVFYSLGALSGVLFWNAPCNGPISLLLYNLRYT